MASITTGQIQNAQPHEVYRLLRSHPQGLDAREAAECLIEAGPNRLRESKGFRWLESLGRQFGNFFSLLLDVAAGMCFVAEAMQSGTGLVPLGWALLVVSILNALFAFFQEFRAERAMTALKRFLPQRVKVRREGVDIEVLAEAVVPGDLVRLAEGDRIPADGRLVEANALVVDNSPLTGESKPLALETAASTSPLLESANVVFAGCSVLSGSGLAVVYATGARTEFGRIAALSEDIARPVSPMERETRHMVRVLTMIAGVTGVAFFIYGVLSGQPLWLNLVFMLGIIVANVPEGLLPTFTLSLATSSLRMAHKNVLVKSLTAIETLGAVHVICTDKTGTLTLNRLAVTQVVDPVSGQTLDPSAQRAALRAGLIASEIHRRERSFSGDPLDVALAQRFEEVGGNLDEVMSHTRRHFPVDIHKRREAGIFRDEREHRFVIKGAWETLRPMICALSKPEEGAVAACESTLAATDARVAELASRGLRVIALASRSLAAADGDDLEEDELARDLQLEALIGFEDPLRPEVPDATRVCKEAGIRVMLITGDHPRTAYAIARNAGILEEEVDQHQLSAMLMLGSELEALSESQLIARIREGVRVFARTTPEQKMKIVFALKHMGLITAMTGDGVNDAPALKAADVGIAMGVGGTDVARESAQIILLDDNFASIVKGIEEGRTVFRNIRKFTTYVLASNVPEIVPVLINIVLPVPLALTIIQILSIDLGTDILPAMGLGQEAPEPDTMKAPPRPRSERLLSGKVILFSYLYLGVIQAAYSLLLFFMVLVAGGWRYGDKLAASDPLYQSATGITLVAVILMQIGNVIGRRSDTGLGIDRGFFRNRLMLMGIGLEILFTWGILYVPAVQEVVSSGPVLPSFYALAWLGVPLFILVDYARKRLWKPQ